MMNILPEFESRQVLTSDELNWLTCYLDSQNRQTRKLLLGCGVIGGLQIRLNTTNNSIELTNGCALTSAGHIVSLQKAGDTTIFTKSKKYTQKEKERLSFPYLSDAMEAEQDYANSVNNPSMYFKEFKDDVYELFEETYNDATPIKANEINGKVGIAFAEIIQTELKDCEEDNCQEKGKKYTFNTKLLLISEADARNLLKLQFQLGSSEIEAISKKAFPWLHLPNVNILKPVFSNLKTTKGIKEIVIIQEYTRCIESLSQAIKDNSENINLGLNNLNDFVSIKKTSFNFSNQLLGIIEELLAKFGNKSIYIAQIYYDYLWTVIKAYQEIQETAQGLRAKCLINESAFPNHVLLGKISPPKEDWEITIAHSEEIYRHPFYSQYTQTEQALLSRKISFLFNRLIALINNFDDSVIKEIKTIKLTPGASLYQPLSIQAIPYYLKSGVTNNWNQNSAQPFLKQNTTYYNYSNIVGNNAETIYNKQPLSFQGNSAFFRIEGVQGQKALDALNNVFKIRKTYGLPYEVIMLRLNEDAPLNYSFNFSVNEDIESIYQVVRAELLKQINLNVSYLRSLMFKTGKYEEMKKSLIAVLAKYYESDYIKYAGMQMNYSDKYVKYSNADAQINFNKQQNVAENLQFKTMMQPYQQTNEINNASAKTGVTNFMYFPIFFPFFPLIESFGALIDSIKKDDKFKNVSDLSFYTNLLTISKTTTTKGSELFYKTLRLYCTLHLQELTLTENFLEFDINTYVKNLNDELLTACNTIIPFLKNAKSDFIKSDSILNEVVKGEMLDYADRIKFDDDWIKMNQINAENKKRNGGLGIGNLLERFIQFHPGISHGCGVPNGGTYIMVYDQSNLVTADFYLPYILSSQLRPIQYTLLENKTITLSGLVTNANKAPIDGAKVTINDSSVLTNSKGEYNSLVSANVTILVTVSAKGYADVSEEINIEGVSKEFNFTLTNITITKTTTVQFIEATGKQIDSDINLLNDKEEEVIAKNGILKVSGTPDQTFQFKVNDSKFNALSFNVFINDKDTTQDVQLIAKKKQIVSKDTWVTSDLNISKKELAQILPVTFNGLPIEMKNGIYTKKYSINYEKEILTIQSNSEKMREFNTDKIPLSKIEAVIVLLKDIRDEENTSPALVAFNGGSQFFTFTKALNRNEIGSLVSFHSGFNEIPASTLSNNNFYCFLLTLQEIKVLKDLLSL